MDVARFIVSPISEIFRILLEFYHSITSSYGISIIILSLTVSLLLTPISIRVRRSDEREQLRLAEMTPLIDAIKREYRGQERFERIDAVYTQFGYHPIKSMTSILPLLLQIPFLLGALFLLVDYPPIQGVPFLIIGNLGAPDHLIPLPLEAVGGLNFLPLALTAVSLLETVTKPRVTTQVQLRLAIVAIVILVLIYPLPAAVCLYWLCSTLWSLTRSLWARSHQQTLK